MFVIGFGANAQSENRVRDEFITTTDRTCGVHYLTHGNTVGWYLTEVEGSCPNGALNGWGHIALRNAFGKVVKTIDGFWTQGYPTRSDYGNIDLKTLWLSDTPNQSLVFDLGTEERLNIRYLGKMTSTRQADDTYSVFDACQPAIVLAVTPDLDFFEDEAVQQELINSVLNRVAPVCPEIHQIYFYGSTEENPENKDVAFFADIDLESGHIKVRRLPSSPRIRDILSNPLESADIPIPKEIRRETGLPIVQITPVKPENKPAPTIKQEPAPKQVSAEPILLSIPQPPVPEPAITPIPTATQPTPALQPTIEAPATEPDPKPAWDDIPALLTASRLLKQPVEGKALVHIFKFDATGVALTDGPTALRLKGENLPLGWVLVQGLFTHTPPKTAGDTIGFVQVQSSTPVGEK